MNNFESYQSPFSWRYGSPKMRSIWGENNKRRLWRKLWVCLARVQEEYGLVTHEQVSELEFFADKVNPQRALEIEIEIQHDLMAEVKTFAEQCPKAGRIIHLGATSMDIKDNAEVLQITQSLNLLIEMMGNLLRILADKIEQYADTPCIAFTHLQPAEPTTLGYRLASYGQDLLMDWETITSLRNQLKGKGFKGAVGTAASYIELLGFEQFQAFEIKLSQQLDLEFFDVANQTYPRKQDFNILSALAGLGASLYKMAFDIRLLQSQPYGEISEPFGARQVGSSAMPFKRNPINCEKINSLARALSQMPQVAWQNAAHSLLERTLDDSANRRTILPESFLACDEIIDTTSRVVENLQVNHSVIQRNLSTYGPFAGTERLMMALVKTGADRQKTHEILRSHAMAAWQNIQQGRPNNLTDLVSNDTALNQYIPSGEIKNLLNVEGYTGIASQQANFIAQKIRNFIR